MKFGGAHTAEKGLLMHAFIFSLPTVLFDHPPEWISGDKSQVPLKMFPNRETNRLVLHDEDPTSRMEGDCRRLNTLAHYQVPTSCHVIIS